MQAAGTTEYDEKKHFEAPVKSAFLFVALFVVASQLSADQQAVTRARHSLNELQLLTTQLAKESQRDAEVLRLLTDAARSLDDWQTNAAFAEAVENVAKAQQLVDRAPAATPELRQAVVAAREILDDIAADPSAANWAKVRTDLHERSLDRVRNIVSEEMHALATLAVLVSDVIADLTEALADGSAAAWSRRR